MTALRFTESCPDIKPTIDAIVHDTFTLSPRSTTPPNLFTSPGSRPTTPKVLPYVARGQRPRPQVTLSYCQSVDGGVAVAGGEASYLADRLRSRHDAVLTGEALGQDLGVFNRIIVLDEHVSSMDLENVDLSKVWIVSPTAEGETNFAKLQAKGARIISPTSMSLEDILQALLEAGIHKLAIEGCLAVRFLETAIFDKLVVTIVPEFSEQTSTCVITKKPRLTNTHFEVLGDSAVFTAEPDFEI